MSLDQLISIVRTFILGPFLVLAFLAGTFVFWKKGGEEYYDQSELMDVLILSCFVALVGARLGFILVHIADFGIDIVRWFSLIAYPGYLGIAGLLCGFFALIWQAKKRKWDAYEVGDFGAIALSLGLVVVFLGEFFNGSGFGNPTTLPVGMNFPGVFDTRHPVQLYAMVLYFLLFLLLWKLERVYRTFIWYRANRRTAQSGFVMSVFLIGYGIIGLLLSFVQPSFLTLYGVNIDVLIRVGVILWGLGLLYARSGRSMMGKKKPPLRPAENSTILPEDVTHITRDTSETEVNAPRPKGQVDGV
jgi:phosphatidylglycerol:prolipoprotein diacylglycerol transferase